VRLECRRDATVGQRRRIDAARKITHGRQGLGGLALHFDQQLARRRDVGLDQLLDDSQVDANGDQMLLRAIMQVALDAASLGILGRHDALA
jgi:hypothetical protein